MKISKTLQVGILVAVFAAMVSCDDKEDVDTDGHEVGSCQKIISSAYADKMCTDISGNCTRASQNEEVCCVQMGSRKARR